MSEIVRVQYGAFDTTLQNVTHCELEEEEMLGEQYYPASIHIFFSKEHLAEANTMLIEKYGLLDYRKKYFNGDFYPSGETKLKITVKNRTGEFVWFEDNLDHLFCRIDDDRCCLLIGLQELYSKRKKFIVSDILIRPITRSQEKPEEFQITPRFGYWYRQTVSNNVSDKPRQLGLVSSNVYRNGIRVATAYSHSSVLLNIADLVYRNVEHYPEGYEILVGSEPQHWDHESFAMQIFVAYAPTDIELKDVVSILFVFSPFTI